MARIDPRSLQRWRDAPVSFVEQVLIDPETNQPFVLLPVERQFLDHAFRTGDDDRLLYPELIYACPKKSGKTTFAGIITITIIVLYGGRFGEAICCANDFEQAQGRIFQMIKRIVECSPLLRADAKITADKVVIAGATVSAIPSNYFSAAGSQQSISVFDELWGYVSERSHRLWDEMVPPPTRAIACRLTVTYAGFSGESTLLEGLYKRGLAQPLVGTDLHAGDGLLMFWSHEPVAPWQTEAWLAEMRRSLRPAQYQRMIRNEFVTTESSFDMAAWDRCIDARSGHVVSDRNLSVWIGVDASTKHDSTAIVAVTFDTEMQRVKLVTHRVFQPSPDQPLDFEATVEATLIDLNKRFNVRKILVDPWQLAAVSQRLTRAGLKIEEFSQTTANLTAASQNLFELINGTNLVCYFDAGMRLAISRTIALETPRGWRIAKEKQSHRIDVVVALAMATYAAVQAQSKNVAPDYSGWCDAPDKDNPDSVGSFQAARLHNYIQSFNPFGGSRWR
jgi:phage terminase large subunit-like protein